MTEKTSDFPLTIQPEVEATGEQGCSALRPCSSLIFPDKGQCLCHKEAPKSKELFSPSVVSDSLRPMDCSTPGFPVFTVSRSLLKPMSIESEMPSNHLILCRPLLLLSSVFPSIMLFSGESVHHIRWPKCWSFSFTISPSSEYSGLISFRVDWFDLFDVLGTHNSLLEYHSSKASILQHSAFFMV